MLKCKEIKGTASTPNVDEEVNRFFENCSDDVEILNLYYSTTAIPFKNTNNTVSYQPVSSVLIWYNDGVDAEE